MKRELSQTKERKRVKAKETTSGCQMKEIRWFEKRRVLQVNENKIL